MNQNLSYIAGCIIYFSRTQFQKTITLQGIFSYLVSYAEMNEAQKTFDFDMVA